MTPTNLIVGLIKEDGAMNMDLAYISAKQKRIKAWQSFISQNPAPDHISADLARTISDYQSLLIACWEKQDINDSDLEKLSSFERRLEDLNEQVRLSAN